MKRRDFLKLGAQSAAAVAAAPVLAKTVEVVPEYKHTEVSTVFAKIDRDNVGNVIASGHHPKALWPGIEEWFHDR